MQTDPSLVPHLQLVGIGLPGAYDAIARPRRSSPSCPPASPSTEHCFRGEKSTSRWRVPRLLTLRRGALSWTLSILPLPLPLPRTKRSSHCRQCENVRKNGVGVSPADVRTQSERLGALRHGRDASQLVQALSSILIQLYSAIHSIIRTTTSISRASLCRVQTSLVPPLQLVGICLPTP